MLLGIDVTLNLLWLPVLSISFALFGFAFRSVQIQKLNKRIGELEREMVQNHAEILSLQKENIQLQEKVKNSAVPVIPITSKEIAVDQQDVALRKKLMGKSVGNQS